LDLSRKKALITGGSRGIGREIALKLASEGADIVINYLRNADAAQEVEKTISKMGVKVLAVKGDISNREDVVKIISQAKEFYGDIDILINNAGITRDNYLVKMSDRDWDSVINSNLNGTYNITRKVIFNMMKRKSGSIVNISSLSGVIGIAGQANYSASKAGIIGLSKALAKEVADFGINVNVVAPGFIHTDMVTALNQNEIVKTIPMKRIGDPWEVAELVSFLVSEKAKYITGQVFKIDGGLSI
jgi:3-oxoacyl-[acyl-carrier protein] reductase